MAGKIFISVCRTGSSKLFNRQCRVQKVDSLSVIRYTVFHGQSRFCSTFGLPPPDIGKVNTNLEDIVNSISTSSSIVVMAGAGLSTASGIPDFRSPTTGIYSNLSKYKLPYPEAIFELEYFKQHPEPFNTWAKEFFPGVNYRPNKGHYFLRVLEEQGKLSKYFTQNIDGLERLAGLKEEKMVEAHGTFSSSSCTSCKEPFSIQELKDCLVKEETPICKSCKGFVKPDIVFFGESLPSRFFEEAEFDCMFADLLICIGTSLEVFPFAGIVDAPRHRTPRILINNELVGTFGARPNDHALLGDIGGSIDTICDKLGWTEQLHQIQTQTEQIINNNKNNNNNNHDHKST